MTTKKSASIFILLSLVLLAGWITGCDDRTIDPFEGTAGEFSIYGALSLDDSTNYIRVTDLSEPFLKDSAALSDVTVTFEDLVEGTSIVLQDTVVAFSGNVTHNYILNKSLLPDRQYRLTVERTDGKRAVSTATTPKITEVELAVDSVDCPVLTSPPEGYRCDEEWVPCREPIDFTFKKVDYPERVRMQAGFRYDGKIHWSEIGLVDQLEYVDGADEMHVRMSPRDLLIEVFPPPVLIDSYVPNPRLVNPLVDCNELDSVVVYTAYAHYGPDWSAWRAINPETGPIDPLKVQDVEGGLGLLGAFRRDTVSFKVNIYE